MMYYSPSWAEMELKIVNLAKIANFLVESSFESGSSFV